MHRVHPGNVAETKTLQSVVSEVLERFPVKRLVLVADRGLPATTTSGNSRSCPARTAESSSRPRGSRPQIRGARRGFGEIDEGKIGKVAENGERIAELEFAGHRLAVAHDPARAKERTEKREKRLGELQGLAREMAARLDAAAAGEKIYGPTLAEQEARDRLADAVSGAKSRSSFRRGSPGAASAGPSTKPRSRRPSFSTASWRW